MVKDPVCGMMVNSRKPPATTVHEDQTFYFCSTDCQEEFENNPELFLAPAELETKPSPADSSDSEDNS